MSVPLLNSLILISSGITVTHRHHALLQKDYISSINRLILTCTLGILFTALQGIEYYEASFSVADGAYGSCFFIATGFHGIHVLVGTIFLAVIRKRMFRGDLGHAHHFGFEAAA